MRKSIAILFSMAAWMVSARQLPPAAQPPSAAPRATATYDVRCSACHGKTMSGATGPSILAFVRYHTDAELTARLQAAHTGAATLSLSDDELKRVLADVRVLGGTDPAMATGGFTGRGRGPAVGGEAGVPAVGPVGVGGFGGRFGGRGSSRGSRGPVTIDLADGRTLTGIIMAESEFDATMLVDRKFHLLA